MTRILLNVSVLVVVLAIRTTTPADARPGVIRAETYACTSWAAAHEYTMQSLTPKGGQINKNCPIRLPQGAKVEVVNEDDDGYAVVTHRGKNVVGRRRTSAVTFGLRLGTSASGDERID